MFVAAIWWQSPLLHWFIICIIPLHQYLCCSALAQVHYLYLKCSRFIQGEAEGTQLYWVAEKRKWYSTWHQVKKREKELTWNAAVDTREEQKSIAVTKKHKESELGLSGGFPAKISKGRKLLNIIPWHKMETKANWQRTKKGKEKTRVSFFVAVSVVYQILHT